LPPAIEPARCEQFLCARDAEFLVEFGPDFVLPAVAAREREVGGAVSAAAREIGNELRVFVVRMSADVQHRGDGAEAPQILQDGGDRFGWNGRTVHRLRGACDRRGTQRQTHRGHSPRPTRDRASAHLFQARD
jgi:hypothetical protein